MAHDTEKLRELLERCEASAKPDRILDAELDAALRFGTPRMQKWVWNNFPIWRASHSGMVEVVHDDGRGGVTWDSQPFTASLDASIALVERMLPGWWWKVGTCSVSDDACIAPDFNSPIHGDRLQAQFPNVVPGSELDAGFDVDRRPAGNPALALLESLLRALISQAESSTPRDGLTRAEVHKMEGGSGLSSCPPVEGEGA